MNKDVVYIEPEDDITDIIARVKNAKQKLVALVPPKKIGVLRSAVNTKLIAKSAKVADKIVVIVTTDQSLLKLAAAAQIPVAKTLQSRPKMPAEIIEQEVAAGEQIIDESDYDDEELPEENVATSAHSVSSIASRADKSTSAKSDNSNNKSAEKRAGDQEFTSDDIDEDAEKSKKSKKSKSTIPTLEKYRKWIIIGGVALVGVIIFCVWAFVFAPAVDIAVAIRTTSNNFSENVTFVTNKSQANAESGIFLLEEQKVEKTNSVEFTATGQKDVGEKASGTLTLVATFSSSSDDGVSILAGTTFSHGEYSYTLNSGVSLANPDSCTRADYASGNCSASQSVAVTAVAAGAGYNIGAYDSSSWTSPVAGVSAYNSSAFTGGTTNIVTVVSEDDFNNAKTKLSNEGREDGRSELIKLFGDDMVVIDSSLEISTSDPASAPPVGEEVKSGVTPKIEATTTYTMYAVDKTALENYIRSKSEGNIASDQRIYAVDTPFFENFSKNDNKYTAKLKSSTQVGPKVSEEDVLEKSKGRKIGEVTSLLKSINGVSSVNISRSFPWVNTVPDDANKITIELKVEE